MARSKHARKIGKLSCPYCGGKHTTKLPCGLDVRDLPERDLAIVATQGSEKGLRHAARAEFGKRVGFVGGDTEWQEAWEPGSTSKRTAPRSR